MTANPRTPVITVYRKTSFGDMVCVGRLAYKTDSLVVVLEPETARTPGRLRLYNPDEFYKGKHHRGVS